MDAAFGGRIPVLYVAPWVDYGGTDKATVDWFRVIDRERFAPHLITTQPSSNRRLAEAAAFAEECWALPDLMAASDFPDFVLDYIESREIRVVHLMNSRLGFDLLPAIAELSPRPATVVQLHSEENGHAGYTRYAVPRYGRHVDAFSVVSRGMADLVAGTYGIPESRCRVIYLGVDAEGEFSPESVSPTDAVDGSRFNVLVAARLVWQKDPLTMVAVAARLESMGRPVRFHVVGGGELEPAVRAAIVQAGLHDTVVLHGWQRDMPAWYAACDAALLTSVQEGIPVAAYEAMAMGLPVVAPRLPGIAEVLDAECAKLVPEASDAGAYAQALAALVDDPEMCTRLGRAGRSRARERFSLKSMSREHERLYRDLAERIDSPAGPAARPAASGEVSVLALGDRGGEPGGSGGQATRAERVSRFASTAAGRLVLVTEGPGVDDPAVEERLMRLFDARGDLDAVALVDAGPAAHPWCLLDAGVEEPHAVAWRAGSPGCLPDARLLDPDRPVGALVRSGAHDGLRMQWRHCAVGPAAAALAPAAGDRRGWVVPGTVLLRRFVDESSGARTVVADGEAPPAMRLELVLGAASRAAQPGTVPLMSVDGPGGGRPLGHLEERELPLLDELLLARHRRTGRVVLVLADADPLLEEVEVLESLGWIHPRPPRPREAPAPDSSSFGELGLVRALDRPGRRHVYGVGAVPPGDLAGELGALHDLPERDSIPVWPSAGGGILTPDGLHRRRPALSEAVRWTCSPGTWADLAPPAVRGRAFARRALTSVQSFVRPAPGQAPNGAPPAGFLYACARPATLRRRRLLALRESIHPVTGDQLLSTSEDEGSALGYGETRILGYLLPAAPVTGELGTRRLDIPWAHRFGLQPV